MALSTANLTLSADAAIDLQMHTVYSDGTWTPEALIDHLVSEGFGLAAITDHDRVDTALGLQQLAMQKQFPLLVAAEISASWRSEPVDVLCFGFDPEASALRDLAAHVLRRQRENTQMVYEHLQQKGLVFSQTGADSLSALLEKPSAQQPHALVALVKAHGYGDADVSPGALVLDAGCEFATVEIAAAADAVHRSGGVCLIAHPGRGEGYVKFDRDLLDQLRAEVPLDGFETHHPRHSAEQTGMYVDYAQKYGLLTSSGSDSHGPENQLPIKYRAELSRRLLERLGVEVR